LSCLDGKFLMSIEGGMLAYNAGAAPTHAYMVQVAPAAAEAPTFLVHLSLEEGEISAATKAARACTALPASGRGKKCINVIYVRRKVRQLTLLLAATPVG
jgi:hypothetical protein